MNDVMGRYDSGDYLKNAPDWHTYDSPWKAGKVYEQLKAHNVTPRTVCDVGCGAGEILVQLQKRMAPGTRFTGFDTSQTAIDLCAPRANATLEFRKADFLTQDAAHYDLLLLLDVFEHVPDYLGFLMAISRRADKFVFHIPLDINATTILRGSRHMLYMRRTYGHLHFFTAETALATLETAGFRVLDCRYTWDREREVYPKIPKSTIGRITWLIEAGILTVERFANRLSHRSWARIRKEYNLLVLAEPVAKNPTVPN